MDLGLFSVRRYVRISLRTGSIQVLADSPLPWQANWGSSGHYPSWSGDGREILLPAVFPVSKGPVSKGNAALRPCVAVVSLPSEDFRCVLTWQQIRQDLEGVWVGDGWFSEGDPGRIVIRFTIVENGKRSVEKKEYRRSGDGTWEAFGDAVPEDKDEGAGLKITVKQGFNEPPVLVASNGKESRVIWEANPPARAGK